MMNPFFKWYIRVFKKHAMHKSLALTKLESKKKMEIQRKFQKHICMDLVELMIMALRKNARVRVKIEFVGMLVMLGNIQQSQGLLL